MLLEKLIFTCLPVSANTQLTETLFGWPLTKWQIINSFANWLSAIGTIAAVVVSLYFAVYARRPRARVSASWRLLIQPGGKPPWPEMLVLEVTNIGDRPIRITSIGWEAGRFKKVRAFQDAMPYMRGMDSPMPADLREGEQARWAIPKTLQDGTEWLDDFAKKILMPKWKLRLRTLKVRAFTSTGYAFEAEPEKTVKNLLKEACQRLTAT